MDLRDGVCIGGKRPPPHFKLMTNTELTLDQLKGVQGGIILLLLAACKVKKANPEPKRSDIGSKAKESIVEGANENLRNAGREEHPHPIGSSSGNSQGQVKGDCENLPF